MTEAREESGILQVAPVSADIFDVDIHVIPEYGTVPEHLHFDVRYALKAEASEFIVSKESNDLAWVPVDSIRPYTQEESMLRMAEKWLLIKPRAFA